MRVFRQNTGAADLNGRMVKFGVKGQADLRCIVAPHGRLVEVEVKKRGGRQSQAQKNYQSMLESLGGVYVLAFCVEDVWQRMRDEFPQHEWQTPAQVQA